MIEPGFIKPKLSIRKIGIKQFWIGLFLGLLFALIINHFFIASREALRSLTFYRDPYILQAKAFRLYDLFFAAFSTSLGFGVTVICWLYTPNRDIKKSYLKTYTVALSFFITFLALATVSRLGSIIPIILYSTSGYDNHLDFLEEFKLLLVLIPLFVYAANWNSIRLLFRSNNWVLISSIVFLLFTMVLFQITYIDRDNLNKTFYAKNKERFDFIEQEFKAARKYDVYFSDSTKGILQKRYAERTINLVQQLSTSFERPHKVPIDTLILEKIVIHNRNEIAFPWQMQIDSTEQNWSYAMPEEIYQQILLNEPNSPETRILFEILSEQISVFTAADIKWSDISNYSAYEIDQYYFKRNILQKTSTIQSRLKQVVEKLRSNDDYKKYHNLIPDFEFIEHRQQKHYKLW